MKHSTEYRVHYYYTDYKGELKPGYLARYMHESAYHALNAFGPSYKYLKENQRGFILSKISLRMRTPIYYDDQIRVITWAAEPGMAIFHRYYQVYKRVGKSEILCAEAVTLWALVCSRTKQLLRSSDLPDYHGTTDPDKLDFVSPRRIALPEEMNRTGTYKVEYTDLDENLHMNNSIYIDLICDQAAGLDAGDKPFDGKRICSLDVFHVAEAPYRSALELYASKNGNENCFVSANLPDGGECFRAQVQISDNIVE